MPEIVHRRKTQPIRRNVVVLAFIAACVIAFLAWRFPTEATAIIAVGGSLVGSLGTALKDLINPPAPPPEPGEEKDSELFRVADKALDKVGK